MNRFSGVTLDWYDDHGETLKRHFPTPESLPDVIKTAAARPINELQPEDFALIALDEGHSMCKFACYDPGTTAMSVIYFMEHGDKLPDEAQKMAAVNLVEACERYELDPPELMVKAAIGFRAAHGAGKAFGKFLGAGKGTVAGGLTGATAGAVGAGEGNRLQGALLGAGAGAAGGAAARHLMKKPLLGAAKEYGQSMGSALNLARGGAKDVGQEMARKAGTRMALKGGAGIGAMAATPVVAGGLAGSMGTTKKTASVVDITGKDPATIIKTALPVADDDYAVIMQDGTRLYPIDTWDRVKMAELYFQEEGLRMEPEILRQFSVKLAAKCDVLGYPLDEQIKIAGALTYDSSGAIKLAMQLRKKLLIDPESHVFLDELFTKRASMEPDTFAEILRRHDVHHGLDRSWNTELLDPWRSTFGINKTANVVWEEGADRVTDSALRNLAENYTDIVEGEFTHDMAREFKKDPVGIFKSLPQPHKKILSRMANDSASVGGSEASL